MNNVSDTVNLSEPIINIKQNKMPQNPFNRDSLPATNTIDNTVINNYDVIYEAKKNNRLQNRLIRMEIQNKIQI